MLVMLVMLGAPPPGGHAATIYCTRSVGPMAPCPPQLNDEMATAAARPGPRGDAWGCCQRGFPVGDPGRRTSVPTQQLESAGGPAPRISAGMSNPTHPRTIDGRFGTVDHPADPSIDLGGPTAAGQALSAQLVTEMAAWAAANARVQLLSVKIAAQGVLRQWPDAPYLQMDHSDQRYGGLVAVAVLDADGQERACDMMELWDDLDNGAHVPA